MFEVGAVGLRQVERDTFFRASFVRYCFSHYDRLFFNSVSKGFAILYHVKLMSVVSFSYLFFFLRVFLVASPILQRVRGPVVSEVKCVLKYRPTKGFRTRFVGRSCIVGPEVGGRYAV